MINIRYVGRSYTRHPRPIERDEFSPSDAAILFTAFRFGVDTARIAEIARMREPDVVLAIDLARRAG